jgi:hypothetical protein
MRAAAIGWITFALLLSSCSADIVGGVASPCDVTSDGVSICRHRMFYTSALTNGNLGGLSGADSLCLSAATSAGLKRSYKALLADSSTLVRSRLTLTLGVSILAGDTEQILAESQEEFWSGTLRIAPNSDQSGNSGAGLRTFTGFNETGAPHSQAGDTNYCANWTDNTAGNYAAIGAPQSRGDWSETSNTVFTCASLLRLYCISQP